MPVCRHHHHSLIDVCFLPFLLGFTSIFCENAEFCSRMGNREFHPLFGVHAAAEGMQLWTPHSQTPSLRFSSRSLPPPPLVRSSSSSLLSVTLMVFVHTSVWKCSCRSDGSIVTENQTYFFFYMDSQIEDLQAGLLLRRREYKALLLLAQSGSTVSP